MDNKLILSILMLLPFVSGIGSVFYAKNIAPEGLEWYLVIGASVPFVNFICALILLICILIKKF